MIICAIEQATNEFFSITFVEIITNVSILETITLFENASYVCGLLLQQNSEAVPPRESVILVSQAGSSPLSHLPTGGSAACQAVHSSSLPKRRGIWSQPAELLSF